jgi:hypothetical protein
MNKKNQKPEKIIRALTEALIFYANPNTYFAIGFFPDPPCGDFIKDFDKTRKPGSLARRTLRKYSSTLIKYY